jgi:transposase
MAFDRANLPTDIATLHQIILAQAAEAEAREAELAAAKAGLMAKVLEIEKYKLQIARLRRMQFGSSSEKIARTIEQLELRLEELEAETPAATGDASASDSEQSSPVEPSSPQAHKQSNRRALPTHLPCRDIVHAPNCICPACGGEMRKVGEDVTRILDYIPGHFEVVRHVRPAFSCRRCESMVQSPMPSLPIERGQAGAGLLAHILVGKYCDHLPLYRQSGIYAREGVELDRTTMAAWVGKVTALASPLVEAIADYVMAAEKLHVDDTPVRPARARRRPDGFGSICATNARSAAARRRRSSIAILPIAGPNIRARSWHASTAFCRPTGIPVSDRFTREPTDSRRP